MKNPDISGLLRTLCIIQNDNAYIVDRSFYDVMLLFFLFPFPQNLKNSSLQAAGASNIQEATMTFCAG